MLTLAPGELSALHNLSTLALQNNSIAGPLDPRLEALARQVDAPHLPPATEGCMLGGNPIECPLPAWASELCHATCVGA